MQIHYLGNSGFALEHEGQMAIIDCYNPGAHARLKGTALSGYSSVTVLVSHAHGDHFNPGIFRLPNAAFVLSGDMPAREGAHLLKPGERVSVNQMDITAYGSTDEGVSFHIGWGGLSIFHAGDLNDWHWRDEGGDAYAANAEADFMKELQIIRAGIDALDYAFFPVDPRMGTDYYRGAVLFAQAMRPKRLIPMHFGARFCPPEGFLNEIARYTELYTEPITQ